MDSLTKDNLTFRKLQEHDIKVSTSKGKFIPSTSRNIYVTAIASYVTVPLIASSKSEPIEIEDKRTFYCVRFEVYTAETMNNGVFRDVTPCGSCKNRRFGGTQRLLHQDEKHQ
jgi:hypothetical protein